MKLKVYEKDNWKFYIGMFQYNKKYQVEAMSNNGNDIPLPVGYSLYDSYEDAERGIAILATEHGWKEMTL